MQGVEGAAALAAHVRQAGVAQHLELMRSRALAQAGCEAILLLIHP